MPIGHGGAFIWVSHSTVTGSPGTDGAAHEHAGKNALVGHNTVTDLLADGAVLVALLADLRHLQQRPADAQARPDGQRFQLEALDQDVFCERTRRKLRQDGTHRLHALGGEQADLPVPGSRVRIALDAMSGAELSLRYRMLHRSLPLADTDGKHLSRWLHTTSLRITN